MKLCKTIDCNNHVINGDICEECKDVTERLRNIWKKKTEEFKIDESERSKMQNMYTGVQVQRTNRTSKLVPAMLSRSSFKKRTS